MSWKPYTEIRLSQRGWITPLIGRLLTLITLPSMLLDAGFQKLGALLNVNETIRKPHMTDAMVFSLFATTCAGAGWVETQEVSTTVARAVLWYSVWRIVDVVASAARIVLFDPYKTHYTSEYKISSTVRSIILGFMNYVELILAFAVIYRLNIELMGPKGVTHDGMDSLYFSAVTQMTVGYGDIQPLGIMRPVASVQAFFGIALMSLFVARFISLLRPVASIEEEVDP